jgi:glycerol-3-phosphate dehydrogenase (NAD(P)+)
MNITIWGAGAWGTALGVHAARSGHVVRLCARDGAQAQSMQQTRVNALYLPNVALPEKLVVDVWRSPSTASTSPDLLVLAMPVAGLAAALTQLAPCSDRFAAVAWLAKGFADAQRGVLIHEMAQELAPSLKVGVLSGPSFAQEVAANLPCALVAASAFEPVRDQLTQAFHAGSLRVYANDDVVGVEVGGAVKNVLAIATGVADGLGLGLNARAALITRGLAEMARLGTALGARAETFMGLSGLGDLVLTATGDLSRNRQVGLLLAQGMTADDACASLGHVAEGVRCAQAVLTRAQSLGVDMPIVAAVVAMIRGQLTVHQTVAQLMERNARPEH